MKATASLCSLTACARVAFLLSTLLLSACVTKRVSVTAPDPDTSKWPTYRCEIDGTLVVFKAPKFKPLERSEPSGLIHRTVDLLAGPGLAPGYDRPLVYKPISTRADHVAKRPPGSSLPSNWVILPDNWTVFNYIYETDSGSGFDEYGVGLRVEACLAGDSWKHDAQRAAVHLLLVDDHLRHEPVRNRYKVEDATVDGVKWSVLYVYNDDAKRSPVTINYYYPISDDMAICFLFDYGFGRMQAVPGWLDARKQISLDVLKSVTIAPPSQP